jgi:hypothetical protein
MLASPRLMKADEADAPGDPFILLLTGIYSPVQAGTGPKSNLGLTKVNLNDGSYSTTKIYPVFGIDGVNNQKKSIGNFYASSQGIFAPTTRRGDRSR